MLPFSAFIPLTSLSNEMQGILAFEMEQEVKKQAEEEAVRSQLKLDIYYFDADVNEQHVTVHV